MSPPSVALASDDAAPAPSAAQARIISAAIDLFARNGVGGTSLQMIADEIGVTKAAIYHQYRTKEEIILAAAEAELARLTAVIDAADAEPTRKKARDVLISGIVELAVERRRTMGTIMGDPVIIGFFAEHQAFREVMHRLRILFTGDNAGPEARVQTAMLIAAVSGAAMHPFVVDLDDDTLQIQLGRLARRFLGLPG